MTSDQPSERQREADLLAEVGRWLFPQDLRVRVRLPASLADRAVAGWERYDVDGDDVAVREGTDQRALRHQAGALALIGLRIKEHGLRDGRGNVVVDLDAWQIGHALDAAEQRGLLLDNVPELDT